MKQSHIFSKTKKEAPAGETSHNAILLSRAGFVFKEMAGVYAYLPLGLRVLDKIQDIVRKEMNAIGGQEMIMSSLQRKELWEKTDRWDDQQVDVWFKSALKNGTDVGFGWSHEEPITDMLKEHIKTYKDLPVFVYQFQRKLRNELRAKSGIMRGREFIMKDLYSYCTNSDEHDRFYNSVIDAYMRIYNELGIGDDTFVTFASGGAFTEYSHEFQTITDAGEDIIYINRDKNIAINEEVYNEATLKKLAVQRGDLTEVKTAEVGNIFNFGTGKCEQLGLYFTDNQNNEIPVHLGSYGIGITRVMGVLVEKFNDERGIIWPENVAPFKIHLLSLGSDENVRKEADKTYDILIKAGLEVLYDDRDESAGSKLADSDLIGIPYKVIIGKKSLAAQQCEVVSRKTGDTQMVDISSVCEFFVKK